MSEKLRLGGMALRNGLLVHGPTHWAAAVRLRGGGIKVASGRKPDLGADATERIPGLRGVTKLAEAFALLPIVKRRLPEARMPVQDARTIAAMGAATLAGKVIRATGGRTLAREAALAAISFAPAVLSVRGDLASYHGVEHKAIGAYEEGGESAEASKEHDRCGSNLVAPLLATTALGSAAARRAGMSGPAVDGAIAIGSVAVAVEVFRWSERHAQSGLSRALRRPGRELQRLFATREPSSEQLEVGKAALAEILRREGAVETD